jgi:hypothetical protein
MVRLREQQRQSAISDPEAEEHVALRRWTSEEGQSLSEALMQGSIPSQICESGLLPGRKDSAIRNRIQTFRAQHRQAEVGVQDGSFSTSPIPL